MLKNYKAIAVVFCLFIVIAAMYYPALTAEYVWDDTLLFVGKTSLLTEPLSWALISEPVLAGTTYFRPLVFLSWYIEFNLLGQSSTISHSIGLIVFYLNTCLVFALCYVLAQKMQRNNVLLCAAFAALFYALHPALIESTVWVSGRFDQFCTLFILLACVLFVKGLNAAQSLSLGRILIISACFFAALLSKELGLVLPVILFLLYLLLLQQTHVASNIQHIKTIVFKAKALWLALIAVLIVYFVLRMQMMHAMYHASFSAEYMDDAILHNWLPLHTLAFYIEQTFLPFSTVSILHPLENWDFGDPMAQFKAILALIFVLYLAWAAWAKRNISAWLAIIALVTIGLVLNIIPLGTSGNLVHERFMTLGLAFVAIALAFLPNRAFLEKYGIQAKTQKMIGVVLISGWFVLCAFTVKSIVPLWHSDYTLWSWTYKLYPDSGLARYNYLYGAVQKQQYDEVIKVTEAYSKKNNGMEVADQLLYATALINTGKKEGLYYFEGAIHALPKFHESSDPDARMQADRFRMTAGQMASAYTSYGIGQVMYNGNVEEGIKYLKIAEWYLLPSEREVLNYQLAAVLFIDKKYDQAIEIFNNNLPVSKKSKSTRYKVSNQILNFYCENSAKDSDVCSKFNPNTTFSDHL